jgi:hypothetical protein
MERADPDVSVGSEDGESFFHFLGGFVGESESGDLGGTDSLMEQGGNAMGNDASFSAAGTGEDEEGTFDELNGLSLRFVQAFEEMSGNFLVHGIYYNERSRSPQS